MVLFGGSEFPNINQLIDHKSKQFLAVFSHFGLTKASEVMWSIDESINQYCCRVAESVCKSSILIEPYMSIKLRATRREVISRCFFPSGATCLQMV